MKDKIKRSGVFFILLETIPLEPTPPSSEHQLQTPMATINSKTKPSGQMTNHFLTQSQNKDSIDIDDFLENLDLSWEADRFLADEWVEHCTCEKSAGQKPPKTDLDLRATSLSVVIEQPNNTNLSNKSFSETFHIVSTTNEDATAIIDNRPQTSLPTDTVFSATSCTQQTERVVSPSPSRNTVDTSPPCQKTHHGDNILKNNESFNRSSSLLSSVSVGRYNDTQDQSEVETRERRYVIIWLSFVRQSDGYGMKSDNEGLD